MKKLLKILLEISINHQVKNNELYRLVFIDYVINLLKNNNITVKNKKFTSLTLDYKKASSALEGQDCLLVFDREKFEKKNKCEEVWYEDDFMKMHPDISQYITGFKNEKEYYNNHDFKNAEEAHEQADFSWEEYIENFEEEQEVVAPSNIKIDNKILKIVYVPKKYENKIKQFENIYNIKLY